MDTVRQLIVEPPIRLTGSFRSRRTRGPQSFVTKSGTENKIDVSEVRYFLPLTVTMEQFGFVTNLRNLAESRISDRDVPELAQVVSLTDLMVIYEVLDLQSEKVALPVPTQGTGCPHAGCTGTRRTCWAFYLDRGFNIDDVEFSDNNFVDLALASKQLDRTSAAAVWVAVDKPALRLTPRWARMLQRLDSDPSGNRLDMGPRAVERTL